ncbi:hypothetical protein BDQ12DRAFT_339467 [Crucibulum laeve]|uniref:Uncharacterized protein n=1 Tax=Crucibulum laeve TaxID=68775 RepID=A0A5C3LP25_9AGAR|nr:hypothetical protein BDQ12DRAFT_339467 [Crucibulum laeve]
MRRWKEGRKNGKPAHARKSAVILYMSRLDLFFVSFFYLFFYLSFFVTPINHHRLYQFTPASFSSDTAYDYRFIYHPPLFIFYSFIDVLTVLSCVLLIRFP